MTVYGHRDYPEDCAFLQKAIRESTGDELSLEECAQFWEWRSCEWCAGWLTVEDHDAPYHDGPTIVEWYVEWVNLEKPE